MTMNKVLFLLMSCAALLAFNAVHAHGNTKPLHGGVMQMVGEMSFELVAGADGTELYVVDDGEDITSADMTAKLMIVNGDASSEAAMQPAGGNKFEAKGVKLPSGAKVAVLLTSNDKVSKVRANFTIK
jgi:hypothetical protein